MFKKVCTTVHSSGRVEVGQPTAWLHEESVAEDMAWERRRLRDKSARLGRIATTEQTLTTLAVVYASGTVVVTQWIAE